MQEKMRVALLNDSFPPFIDGVANVVSNYARILTENNCGVLVATPEYPGVTDRYPYPVLRYKSLDTTRLVGYRAGYPLLPGTVGAINDFRPHILHAHCPTASALLARTARESTHAPVVFTYHTKYDIDIRTAIKNEKVQQSLIRALVRVVSAADEVWVVSRGAGQNLWDLGYEGDFRVMQNGADMPRGKASASDIAALRAQHNLQADIPILLFAGRMRWYKGIELILRGLAIVKAQGVPFRMVFVGDGQDLGEIQALCQQLQLDDYCIFAGAVQGRSLLRTYYSAADLFLFPSTFDTNGLVVREAAACCLPSLLVRGSCAAEGVTHMENGLLMEETAEDLARQVIDACRHREALKKLGENAQRDVYISWETAIGCAQERYAQIIEEQKKPKTDRVFPVVSDLLEAAIRLQEWQEELREKGRGKSEKG